VCGTEIVCVKIVGVFEYVCRLNQWDEHVNAVVAYLVAIDHKPERWHHCHQLESIAAAHPRPPDKEMDGRERMFLPRRLLRRQPRLPRMPWMPKIIILLLVFMLGRCRIQETNMARIFPMSSPYTICSKSKVVRL
jgi:hypothetical protein